MCMMTSHFYFIKYKAVLSPVHFLKKKKLSQKALMTFVHEEIQVLAVRVLWCCTTNAILLLFFASVSYCFLWTIKPQAVEIIWYNNGVKSTCSSDPVCF